MSQPSKIGPLARWLKAWNEGPLSMVLLVAFIYLPRALHLLDPTSGSFDLGYLHVLVLACLFFFLSGFVAWNAMRLNFPALYREMTECFDNELERNTTTTRTWRVLCFSLLIYFFYLALMLAFVLIAVFSVPR